MNDQGVVEPFRHALLLAVGEACANAVEHAYREGASGDVHVDIAKDGDRSFAVSVRDFGRFHQGSSSSEDRGRGTDIMRGLTTDFTRHSSPSGTTVRFRLPMDLSRSA
jgi:anti-sigma regulatory factor (Ser/Thr protein kinase)